MREWELHLGDALRVLPTLPDGSADAVVCDPPYNLAQIGRSLQLSRSGPGQDYDRTAQRNGRERGFMGCEWDDTVAFRPEVWAECLRVAKAGAYLLAFGGTRTHHRLMCAVEDAGWELTDTLCWLHGQGFPKGKGCLKPAWEPIVLARKEAPRVVPLNIDECRIGTDATTRVATGARNGVALNCANDGSLSRAMVNGSPAGRYPPNLCLSHHEACVCRGTRRVRGSNGVVGSDQGGAMAAQGVNKYHRVGRKDAGKEVGYAGPDGTEEVEDWVCVESCPVRLLDEQAGERPGDRPGRKPRLKRGEKFGWGGDAAQDVTTAGFEDSGHVSRFFYVSKASRADRGEGNDHPTTKSTALMSWLVKLVARPGETVLDPFAGSGSTGVACLRCERRFVGIEKDAHYHAVALKRLAAVDGPLFAAAAGGGP